MCRAKIDPTDALLQLFHERYGLNLLALPSADVEPGQFVIARKGAVARRLEPGAVLDGPLRDLAIERTIPMADVRGVESNAVSADLAASVSEAFIAALGGLGLVTEIGGAIRGEASAAFTFAFPEPRFDRLNLELFRGKIAQRRLDPDSPFHDSAAEYYVVNAVARSKALDMSFGRKREAAAEVTAKLEALGEGHAGVSVTRLNQNVIRFHGDKALGFGVELFKLSATDSGRLKLGIPTSPLRMRVAPETHATRVQSAFLGRQNLFVAIDPVD